VELHLHSPNTPSWRGAQGEHRDDFTFTFYFLPSIFHYWQLTSMVVWDPVLPTWQCLPNRFRRLNISRKFLSVSHHHYFTSPFSNIGERPCTEASSYSWLSRMLLHQLRGWTEQRGW
jgi:hypothetical protein